MRTWWMLASMVVAFGCSGETRTGSGSSGSGGAGSGGTGAGGIDCACEVGAYVPVCGSDGMTYDAACGQECVPVDIACQGECPCESCADLEQQYADAIADGKVCGPQLDCTILVPDRLACPCDTYIAWGEVQNVLDPVRADWLANGCAEAIDCAAIACPQLTGATCQIDPGAVEGTCVDQTN